ncbi:MAG: methylated-DNA--[protein]-cysteine S-methyltransferase [Candidatus Dormibacteria bacterium]
MTIIATTVETPAGPLTLLTVDGVARAAALGDDPGALLERLPAELRALPLRGGGSDAAEAVRAWADGDTAALDRVRVEQPGGPFFRRAWAEMRRIPAGTTVSYAELAARAGAPRAVRAAATACARNGVWIIVPCHRVVRSDGSLGGYAYGLDAKRRLLAHEAGGARGADLERLPTAV